MKKRTVALLLALVLVIGVAAGGTIAWLTANSDTVTNTFTTSGITIALGETKNDFKMVPGFTIEKDPKVTVEKGSEACYLFVKVDESANLKTYIDYKVIDGEDGWTQLTTDQNVAVTGVYYRKVAANTTDDQVFEVIGYQPAEGDFVKNKVLVKDTVGKTEMEAAKTTAPTLTFTAYASQLYKTNGVEFSAYEAWQNAQPTTNP